MGRLPRNRRVKNPPPMRLTNRDVEIIKNVHEFRIMRGDQIQALFFGSQSTASYRLSRLYQHQYLDKHFLPTLGGISSSPTLYTLDKLGFGVLREIYEFGPEDIRHRVRSKELSPLFLEHLLKINDVRVAVTLAVRQNRFALETWYDESVLKSDYDRVTINTPTGRNRNVSLIPDSYFTLRVPQGRSSFFLELDRGTMTTGRYKEKILAYMKYVNSGKYQSRYNTRSLRVLTITLGKRRMKNLKQVTEKVGGKRIFWYTELLKITSTSILDEPIWQVAGFDSTFSLVTRE